MFLNVDIEKIVNKLTNQGILELLEEFHIHYLNSKIEYNKGQLSTNTSKINSKERGSVYTQDKIAREISIKSIENKINSGLNKNDLRILDFGCGRGKFI